MGKRAPGLLALIAAVALASAAQAQICAGYPSPERGMYFGGRVDLLRGDNAYGVEANYNVPGPLGLYGGTNVIFPAIGGNDLDGAVFAGVALQTPALAPMLGPDVSACAVAEIRNVSADGFSRTQIPLGFGVGGRLGPPGVAAYVQPQLVFASTGGGGLNGHFALKAGTTMGLGVLSLGVEARKAFEFYSRTTFSVRAAIAF